MALERLDERRLPPLSPLLPILLFLLDALDLTQRPALLRLDTRPSLADLPLELSSDFLFSETLLRR